MKKTLIMIFTVFVLGITAFAVFASGNPDTAESTAADESASVEASSAETASAEEVFSEIISESESAVIAEETVNTSVCNNRFSENCPYREECSSECERADAAEHLYCCKNCEYGCKAAYGSADSSLCSREYCEPHTYQQAHHKVHAGNNQHSHGYHHGR